MRSLFINSAVLAVLAFSFSGCKKDQKEITEVDITTTSTFTVTTTSATPKWTAVEVSVPVATGIGAALDAQGITADNVGTIKEKNFVITVSTPSGGKMSDFNWFENYEFWMDVPDVDRSKCANKTEYAKFIAAGNTWQGVETTMFDGNLRSYVIENGYNLRFIYWLNGNTITSPTIVFKVTQVFTVKAIK
jgi:hypothetical protein